MSWVRIDDAFADHPKVLSLGRDRLAGMGALVSSLCYSARFLTDGVLPSAFADQFPPRLRAALVTAGLWDKTPTGYLIHDYLDFNPSREKVLTDRATKAAAGSRGGSTTQAGRKAPAQAGASAVLQPSANPRPLPVPPPVDSKTPTAVPERAHAQSSKPNGREPRLTRAQLDAWATFTEPCWLPFKTAWLFERHLLFPPFGTPEDDAGTSQRSRLYRIADARPSWLAETVRAAPGKTAHDIIAFIFERWADLEVEVGATEEEVVEEQRELKRDRRPLEKLGGILPRVLS